MKRDNGVETAHENVFDDDDWTFCKSVEEARKLLVQAQEESLSPLNKLNLRGLNLEDKDALALAPWLGHSKHIQQIQLSYNNIGARGAVAIVEACLYHPSIQCLWLADNRIGADGAKAIARMLREKRDGKERVKGEEEEQKFDRSEVAFLDRIDLCRNGLGNEGCEILLKELTKCNHVRIRRLGLALNSLGSSDHDEDHDGGAIAALCKVIAECSYLEGLILDGNPLGEAGAQVLARTIGDNPQIGLKKLYVRKTGLKDDSVRLLMSANGGGSENSPRVKIYFQ